MNLFTGNSPHYHLLKYLLFLLRHPVYILFHSITQRFMRNFQTAVSSHPLKIGHMFIWTYLLGTAYTTTF